MEHLTFSPAGLEIELPVSKTDQERTDEPFSFREAVAVTARQALMHWLKTAGIRTGHVFRSVNRYDGVAKQGLTPQSVALIVKAAMAQTGANAQISAATACELATALPLPSKAYRLGRYVCRRGTNPMYWRDTSANPTGKSAKSAVTGAGRVQNSHRGHMRKPHQAFYGHARL
jgi:hypothetical protein